MKGKAGKMIDREAAALYGIGDMIAESQLIGLRKIARGINDAARKTVISGVLTDGGEFIIRKRRNIKPDAEVYYESYLSALLRLKSEADLLDYRKGRKKGELIKSIHEDIDKEIFTLKALDSASVNIMGEIEKQIERYVSSLHEEMLRATLF